MDPQKCSMQGCERRLYAKSFCHPHYIKTKGLGEIPGPKCRVENCNKGTWGNGFCRSHNELNRRNGKPEYKASYGRICCVLLCNKEATPMSVFCNFHLMRHRNGVPLEIPKGKAFLGERNPRWNGGNSEYPNHSEMKRVRKEVLKEANNICHFCGGFANEIHHKDHSKNNHSRNNLVACCHGCNHRKENMKTSTSKFKRLYGYTVKELIAQKVFGSYYDIPKEGQQDGAH